MAYYYGGMDGYDVVEDKAIMKSERKDEQAADPAAFDAKYKSTIQDLVCDYVWVKKYQPAEGADTLVTDIRHYEETWIDGHIFDDNIFTSVQPEGGSDLAAINTQIEEYWAQQFPQIVMADTPEKATELMNSTLSQMDSMGMVDLDTYKNEKYQKNKEKMGVQFAWPRNMV